MLLLFGIILQVLCVLLKYISLCRNGTTCGLFEKVVDDDRQTVLVHLVVFPHVNLQTHVGSTVCVAYRTHARVTSGSLFRQVIHQRLFGGQHNSTPRTDWHNDHDYCIYTITSKIFNYVSTDVVISTHTHFCKSFGRTRGQTPRTTVSPTM